MILSRKSWLRGKLCSRKTRTELFVKSIWLIKKGVYLKRFGLVAMLERRVRQVLKFVLLSMVIFLIRQNLSVYFKKS